MVDSQPQSCGYAVSIENSIELSTSPVHIYQQQQQITMQQPLQSCINENQNCDNEDVDDTNCIENSFLSENGQLFETMKLSKRNLRH